MLFVMKQTEVGFVLQPNHISRASYKLSVPARRLIAMAMSALDIYSDKYQVSFSIKEFEEALGITHSGHERKELLKAVRECLNSHIEIFVHRDGDPRVGTWYGFTWFSQAHFEMPYSTMVHGKLETMYIKHDIDTLKLAKYEPDFPKMSDRIFMSFNRDLGEAIKAFKKAYAKLDLVDLGRMRSLYAVRYYEIAMSWSSEAGKNGNKPDQWYFEKSLVELRILFMIDENQYKLTRDFRIKVIENPLKELNEAEVGIKIAPEYMREGRKLVWVRFHCEHTVRKAEKVEEKQTIASVSEQKQSEADKKTAETVSERDKMNEEELKLVEAIRRLYPSEFKAAYDIERAKQSAFNEKFMRGTGVTPEQETRAACAAAVAVQERHGTGKR
jgi:plasmid replication initiation protein